MDDFFCHTVVETPEFIRQIQKYLLEIERDALIAYLAAHPLAGVIVKGAGGIRKIRWAYDQRGKRGGLRVMYWYDSNQKLVYALTAYTKSDKDLLSPSELRQLSALCRQLEKDQGGNNV